MQRCLSLECKKYGVERKLVHLFNHLVQQSIWMDSHNARCSYNIHCSSIWNRLAVMQMVTVVIIAVIASIGTAGVPGVGLVMLAMILTSIGINPPQSV